MFAFGAEQVTLHYSPEAHGNFTLLNSAEYVDGGTATERAVRCKLASDEPPTPFLHAGTLVTLPGHCTTAQALARRNGEPHDGWRPPFFQVLVDATSLNIDLANKELDGFRRADLLEAFTAQQRAEAEESEATAEGEQEQQKEEQRQQRPRLTKLAGLALEARLGRTGAVPELTSLLVALLPPNAARAVSPHETSSRAESPESMRAHSLDPSQAGESLDDEIARLPGAVMVALKQMGQQLMQVEPGSEHHANLLRDISETLLPPLRLVLPQGKAQVARTVEVRPEGGVVHV